MNLWLVGGLVALQGCAGTAQDEGSVGMLQQAVDDTANVGGEGEYDGPLCLNNVYNQVYDPTQSLKGKCCVTTTGYVGNLQPLTYNPKVEFCWQSCSHKLKETGVALVAACCSCAARICAADPYCCTTAWDRLCVNEAQADTNCWQP